MERRWTRINLNLSDVSLLLDPACGLQQLEEWDEKGSCFTKTWDTPAKRRKLWCVCNRSQY